MNSLHDLLKIHKETVLIDGNGFAVDCVLKPSGKNEFTEAADTPAHACEGFNIKGFSSFIGVSFEDNHTGYFGDSFELTVNVETLKKLTDLIPTRGWNISVNFPQMNETPVNFKIENVALDRTLGMYLIKCSASTSTGNPKSVKRQSSGGM